MTVKTASTYTSRYALAPRIGFGSQYGTSNTIAAIRSAMKANQIQYVTITLQDGMTLDRLAGQYFGDSRYYWVIAAASNIGFAPQCPPGTVVHIPTDLQQVLSLAS